MKRPPLINNFILLHQKCEMLETLSDIQLTLSILQKESAQQISHPLDCHYKYLNCEIKAIESCSQEFQLIQEAVKNTHAESHQNFSIHINQIFSVNRAKESKQYRARLSNQQFLWHGSRISNYCGILSQGLRIAPPESPITGHMFGKGIYFADMVSKSANYCYPTKAKPRGLLVLCQVALGNSLPLTSADCDAPVKLSPAHNRGATKYGSVKGAGKTFPNPLINSTLGSCKAKIFHGSPITDSEISSDLLYNEFIVYNTNQVKLKYLLHCDFRFH
eukprot:Sdes_comp20219_c0_seq1m13594